MPRSQARPPRLQEVAREAGVHFSTASRVLNNVTSVPIRPETRRRVLETASRLGYRPNAIARGLKTATTGAIGLLVPSLRNPILSEMIHGAFERAWERDFVVLLAEDSDTDAAQAAYDRLVSEGRIDGLLIATARPGNPLLSRFASDGVPCVFVNRRHLGSGRNVSLREEDAAAVATGHLIELGHTRLAHVAGPAELDTVQRRVRGFVSTAEAAGLAAPVAHAPLDEAGGSEAARTLLETDPRPTGVFVSNINQAVGTLAAARRLGLDVPAELSIVTCDDDPLVDYLEPPLTTVRMPLRELGVAAVDALLDQIEGAGPRDVTLETPPQLVRRRSTAPPP